MKNIVVLVSGGGTNLQALIDGIENGTITNGKIVAVLSSNPNAFALKRAVQHNIKTYVLQRKDFLDDNSFYQARLEYIKSQNTDLIVTAGYMSILDNLLTSEYRNRIINVHPSLIPSFCGIGYYGMHVHEKVLASGVKLTGATVHFINEIVDGGPIIAQKAVAINEDDTPSTLQKRVMEEAEHIILPEAVSLFCNDLLIVNNNLVSIKKTNNIYTRI